MKSAIPPPFPWFGGKSRVAPLVWEWLGDVRNYVEPFFGSGAVLMGRPHYPFAGRRTETANDADGMVANFWRAVAADPDAVAAHADWPVSEPDLHARHLWLVNEGRRHVARLVSEPEYYDAKIAGWWVWGLCQWIGGGWCADGVCPRKRPHLLGAGMGVYRPSHQLPSRGDAGMGVYRPSHQLPSRGDAGMGVHRPSHQLPSRGDAGKGLAAYFAAIAARLRGVRVCCGDWSRVCGPIPTTGRGLTGVFLDPPYALSERDAGCYAVDTPGVTAEVRRWCLDRGGDPLLRIALCGYAGEGHEVLGAAGWSVVEWKARGGYGNRSAGRGRANAARERVWFSPHCRRPDAGLFALSGGGVGGEA